jgi:DNA invertase Pin-like site-specific DNA recombinase
MMYGYARVSTDGQSVEAQVAALRAAGAVNVYREVASGAQTDRAQLRQGLARLAAGAVRMVTRLDRLARSTRDLLTVLGGLTEFERELIRARTSEGRARAQARGVRLGRRPKFTPTKSVRRSAAARTASH